MTMQGNLQQRGNKSGTRTSSGRESKSQTNVSIVRHYDSGKKYKKRKSSVNSRMERIIRVLFASLCIFILIIIVVGLYMQNHMDNERSKVDPNLVLRPDEMADVGDKSIHYRKLREAFDKMFPADTFQDRFGELTRKLRERQYKPTITPSEMGYDVFNCPDDPPENYPYEYNLLKLMDNWQPDDPEPRTEIFQGICVFNHATEYDKAMRYREAEVPFVIRDDPDLLRAAERWNQPEYLEKILGNVKHRAEYSPNNHFMYWVSPRKESRNKKKKNPVLENWKPPTENIHMKYIDWVSKANVTDLSLLGPDEPHWYFRLIGCGPGLGKNCDRANSEFVFDEIPIFQPWPHSTLYLPHPGQQRGIHCRFGMRGIIAGKKSKFYFCSSSYIVDIFSQSILNFVPCMCRESF